MPITFRANFGSWLATQWGALAKAFLTPAVRRGLYGTLLIAAGAFSPAYLPRSSGWYVLAERFGATGPVARTAGTTITMVGLLLLVDSWFRLRPRHLDDKGNYAYKDLRHWAILAIWGLPFLLAPPIFSHDAYSYAAQGWLIVNGINPYDSGPAVLPGGFADQVSWVWRDTPAPYGPLSLQLQHLVVVLSGYRPYESAVGMRVLAVLSVAVIGLLIPRIATLRGTNPATAAWFATLNPVLVVDFVGGCHNDGWMMAFVVAGIWVSCWPAGTPKGGLGIRLPWWLLGAVLVGVGAAIKQPAFMTALILPLLNTPWTSWRPREVALAGGRILLSLAIAVATFASISVVSGLGFGWINAVNVPGMVITIAPFTVLGQGVQLVFNLFDLDPTGWAAIRAARTVGVVLAAATLVTLGLTIAGRQPLRFLAYGYLATALALPALRSWYILWGGMLLPLANPSRRTVSAAIWVTVVLLSYNGINQAWRNDAIALGSATAVGLGTLALIHQRTVKARVLKQAAHQRQPVEQMEGSS